MIQGVVGCLKSGILLTLLFSAVVAADILKFEPAWLESTEKWVNSGLTSEGEEGQQGFSDVSQTPSNTNPYFYTTAGVSRIANLLSLPMPISHRDETLVWLESLRNESGGYSGPKGLFPDLHATWLVVSAEKVDRPADISLQKYLDVSLALIKHNIQTSLRDSNLEAVEDYLFELQ